MGAVASEQAEWAVVDRLRQMLDVPQGPYLATQSYALFSSIVCWVLQHIRIHQADQLTDADRSAGALLTKLQGERAVVEPWLGRSEPAGRTLERGIPVPFPVGFDDHHAARFLVNLRDAMAHGDARTVQPFNHGEQLVGFSFNCSERKNPKWKGEVVLLRSDMRRIGTALASQYCAAIKAADAGGDLQQRAEAIQEEAA